EAVAGGTIAARTPPPPLPGGEAPASPPAVFPAPPGGAARPAATDRAGKTGRGQAEPRHEGDEGKSAFPPTMTDPRSRRPRGRRPPVLLLAGLLLIVGLGVPVGGLVWYTGRPAPASPTTTLQAKGPPSPPSEGEPKKPPEKKAEPD